MHDDDAPPAFGEMTSADLGPGADEFRLLADNLPTLCWMARANGDITWYNRRWYDYTGSKPDEMEGWGWRSVHHPDHLGAVMERWTSSIASGEPFEMVFPLRSAAGDYSPFLTRVQPYRDDAGRIVRWFGSNTDVSGQVAAEQAVKALEAEQAAILNQLAEGVIIADAQGRITFVNPAAIRLHGVRRLDVAPDDYSQAYHLFTESGEPYPPQDLPLARAVAKGETVTEARWRIRRPDGVEVLAIGNAQPLFDGDDGERVGAVLTLRDDTARHSAERAMQELNETLERRIGEGLAERKVLADIVETTDAMIMVLDTSYTVLATNRANADEFERIYGVRPAVGDDVLGLLADHPTHQKQVREGWAPALAGKEFSFIEAFGDPARDRPFYEIKFNVLRDGEGRQIGAYQFVYDVTERLRREAELEQARETLRQSQKMEALGQLTGGIAHDFNNLLTVIRSSADLLRKRDLPADRQRRYVDAVSDTADRAAKLTGQLLAFSRRQNLRAEVFDVAERVERIGDMLGTLLGARVRLEIHASRGSCFARADAGQFETAVVNMAVNARDAIDGDGLVRIGVERVDELPVIKGRAGVAGRFVAVSVSDTGVGIAPEVLERVFEPFFTTKETGKGTGLGLSQVYGFAKQTGGEIVASSAPGAGSTFTIYLPHAEAARPPADPDLGRPRDSAGRGRILVVDDNPEVGEFAAQLLSDLGYETVHVGNGGEALTMLSGDGPAFDVVFSDVLMPGMNGFQLARTIGERWPNLSVVLTSGYSHMPGQDAHHDFPLLKKPYSVEELASIIRKAL